jgi:hypothetical protein
LRIDNTAPPAKITSRNFIRLGSAHRFPIIHLLNLKRLYSARNLSLEVGHSLTSLWKGITQIATKLTILCIKNMEKSIDAKKKSIEDVSSIKIPL